MKTLWLLALAACVIAVVQAATLRNFLKDKQDLHLFARSSSDDGSSMDSSEDSGDSSDSSDSSDAGNAMATGTGGSEDGGSDSEDSSEGDAAGNMAARNNQSPSNIPASLAPGATAQPTADTTAGPSTNCILAQECTEVDLLQGAAGDAGLSPSALYSAAFSVFNDNSFTRSVQTLISEFNDRSTIQCARDFTEFNDTALQVTQTDGSGLFDYFFPEAQTPGQPRTLENSQVDVTLPNLGTFGDLRLRYFFDASGDVETVQRFIRPPNQATDMFFPFPLRQTVCRDIPGQCATSQVPPTVPPNVLIPDPLPEPSQTEVATLVGIQSSAAQCAV
eukprot:scpid75884/ scgid20728/ 